MHPVPKILRVLLLLLVTSTAAMGHSTAQAESVDVGWEKGHLAPPLRLPTIDGAETIDLYSLRGTPILLLEFASW